MSREERVASGEWWRGVHAPSCLLRLYSLLPTSVVEALDHALLTMAVLTMAVLTAYLGGGSHESHVTLHHVRRAWLG